MHHPVNATPAHSPDPSRDAKRAAVAAQRRPPETTRPIPVSHEVTLPPPADLRFGLIVAAAFALVLLPRILLHVMWRDEWQAWMLAVPTPTLGELFARLRYEGHPGGWHLLLWLVAQVWPDPMAMKLLHLAVAAGGAFVVAAYAPLPRATRVLVCLGYFLFFEFAVLSRNYGLGVLPLLGFAAVAHLRPRAFVLQGLLLALAAQANSYSALLAAAAGVETVVRWHRLGRPDARRFVAGAFVLTAGFTLMLVQLWPPHDRAYTIVMLGPDVERGGRVAAGVWRSFFPLPYPGRFWWGNNVLDFTLRGGRALMAVQPVLGLATFGLVTWLLPRRVGALTLWLVGGAGLVAFLYVVFPGGLRHQGHWVILALLSLWLGGGFASLSTLKRRLWVGLLCVQAFGGVAASAADVVLPFSASRAAGDYIAAHYPADTPTMGWVDFAVSPVAGVLGRPVYYPSAGRLGRYVRWNNERLRLADGVTLAAEAGRLADERRAAGRPPTVLLVVSYPDQHPRPPAPPPDPGPAFRPVARFDDATVEDERYALYEFVPAP